MYFIVALEKQSCFIYSFFLPTSTVSCLRATRNTYEKNISYLMQPVANNQKSLELIYKNKNLRRKTKELMYILNNSLETKINNQKSRVSVKL